MAKLKVGGYEVETKESLTWGDMEDVQMATGSADPSKTEIMRQIETQHLLLSRVVTSIKKDGETLEYSQEWLRGLEVQDAMKLIVTATSFLEQVTKTTAGN